MIHDPSIPALTHHEHLDRLWKRLKRELQPRDLMALIFSRNYPPGFPITHHTTDLLDEWEWVLIEQGVVNGQEK
jgi:hypothetical protein